MVLGFPHYLLMCWSPGRTVIESDVRRWLEERFPNRQGAISLRRDLALLLWNYAEFRSLFYYRVQSYEHLLTRMLLVHNRPITEKTRPIPFVLRGNLAWSLKT